MGKAFQKSIQWDLNSPSRTARPGASIYKGGEGERASRHVPILVVAAMLAFYFVPLVRGESNPARTQVIFPAVVNTKPVEPNCDFWESGFSVFNPNPGPVTVTFTAFDSNSVVKETST